MRKPFLVAVLGIAAALPPTGKRYYINGNVLKFVPDTAAK